MKRLSLNLGVALALLSSGCGSVGEPLPPLLNIPARVEPFEVRQVGSRVVARWVTPDRTTEGANLRRDVKVVLYALDFAAGAPPTAEVFEDLAEPIAEAEDGVVDVDISNRFGKLTAFAALAVTDRGKTSPLSELLPLALVRPALAPRLSGIETGEGAVRLQWDPVDGAARYLVERRVEGEEAFREIGRATEPQFEDASFVWDQKHFYRVRTEAESQTGFVPSEPSPESSVTPRDVFPPPPPRGLRSVVTPTSIELTWEPSAASDLAGYRVLRDGAPTHDGLIETPTFSDPIAASAPTTYTVVAVDRDANVSAPSEPHQTR